MTMLDAARRVGTDAWLRIEELHVHVEIVDVKQAWGEFRYLVRPMDGVGTQWVSDSRVKLKGE